MSTAEVASAEESPRDERRDAPSNVPPESPVVAAGWLLRAAALCAVAAGGMGLIVAPGLRGHATERAVETADWIAAALSYFLVGILAALLLWGAIELARVRAVDMVARIVLIGGGAVVVASSSPGLRDRLPPPYAVIVSAAAVLAAVAGGYVSARAPHTRALSGVLFALAFAAIARLGAWGLATAAGERASMQLFGWSRALATAGVMFEATGHMVAVTWLWTRSRSAGQLGSAAAVIGAYVVTAGVAHGAHSGAAQWQAVLYTALADASGFPPPYRLDPLATFLVPSSLLLGLVASAQPRQVVAVVAAMALALVSRGSFDVPLRALCVAAAAQWAALACADPRSMWRTLIDDRNRRLADGDVRSD